MSTPSTSLRPILIALLITLAAAPAFGQAVKTEMVHADGKWQLLRGGEPFFVRGVGTGRSLALLPELGANAVRTWGVGPDTKAMLDEAHEKGLAVAVGIWLPHERHGFDYSDSAAVEKVLEDVRAAVQQYKDHPAVLMWGIGNEMEGYEAQKPVIYEVVNRAARLAKSLDPHHPTMTVIAGLGIDNEKVALINRYCPDIDILGINIYGGAPQVGGQYVDGGGVKPYILTEHGPRGHWESPKTPWGLPIEKTSTQKGEDYRAGYAQAVLARPSIALGSFAFLWGHKQEQTATWYGMLLPDNSRLECVDVMSELWTGRAPANRVPKIKPIEIASAAVLAAGEELHATVEVTDPESDPIRVRWVLREATTRLGVGGDREDSLPDVEGAVISSNGGQAVVRMPRRAGSYRLFAYAYDGAGGAAVANVPLLVEGGTARQAADAEALPFVVYEEAAEGEHYVPSGYMGATEQIRLDPKHAAAPHAGKHCIRVLYTSPGTGDWGGVVWQDPANDWGEKPGGYNLTGATTLSFWAKGERGGEAVNFGFGVLGADTAHPDSAGGKLDNTVLTDQWKRYTIDLAGKDLSQIKTGFYWSLAGQGKDVVFYLDDIVFEKAAGDGAGGE